MTDYLLDLKSWVQEREAAGFAEPSVQYHSSLDFDKRAAWIVMESSTALGQIIVWETGEAEVDFGTLDGARSLIQSHLFSSSSEVLVVLQDILGFFEIAKAAGRG